MIPFTAKTCEMMDGYNGREGLFIKGFILSDKRNKNGWRATRESIRKNFTDFLGRPGIEFVRCKGDACTRDHTNSTSYRKAMAAQEHYRVSNIIDVIWNEESGILSAVEHIIDEEFAEKIRQNKSIYRSPALWPREIEKLGTVDGRQEIDVLDWYALHSAHIDDPAFGEEARMYNRCEGHGPECKYNLQAVTGLNEAVPHEGGWIFRGAEGTCTPCQQKKLAYKADRFKRLLKD